MRAHRVVDKINAGGSEAMAIKADVSREDDVRTMFQRMFEARETIDILVNNAGLQKDAPFTEMTLAQWDTVATSRRERDDA